MDQKTLLNVLHLAEKLKDTTRHSYTSQGRHESVAEHSWRLTLFAYLIRDEFPEADIDKVIRMCMVHDLGEAFTGDIPAFDKTDSDEDVEKQRLYRYVRTLPEPYSSELIALYDEMYALETTEAKIYKALDNMEAVIQHNESDISTWEEHEYQLQQTYGFNTVAFSPYLSGLREEVRQNTVDKIKRSQEGQTAPAPQSD